MSEENEGEACQRCHQVDQDRRTLWIACFYAMDELRVPFDQVQITGHTYALKSVEDTLLFAGGPLHSRPIFDDRPIRPTPDTRTFYTLRVCKDCRADWMTAIEEWFERAPASDDDIADEEAVIPIRDKGTTRLVTREEYGRLYPGRVPIEMKGVQSERL